jgi:hypothetical protein
MPVQKNTIVYRVRFGNTEYLLVEGKTADQSTWGYWQSNAKRFTQTKGIRIARKFNSHLDVGVPKRYGWSVLLEA